MRAFAASDEPGYDPTDDIIAKIDASRPKPVPVEPAAFLAEMREVETIGAEQHDAGAILLSLAQARRPQRLGIGTEGTDEQSANKGGSYRWRNRAGTWSDVTLSNAGDAEARLKDWLASVATPRRRKALVQVCVAEHPVRPDVEQFVAGLADLAARFWPEVKPYVDARGVKLPGVSILKENDATLERLAHANDNYLTPDGVRVVKTTAFEMLHGRRQLDRDSKINELLYAAGVRYQSDYHQAMMAPLKAVDYDRPSVDGGKSWVYSERTQRHRTSLEGARAAMGERYRALVDAIVLEGQSLIAFGMTASSFKHRHQITAQMGERLNAGLRRLAGYYRLIKE